MNYIVCVMLESFLWINVGVAKWFDVNVFREDETCLNIFAQRTVVELSLLKVEVNNSRIFFFNFRIGI